MRPVLWYLIELWKLGAIIAVVALLAKVMGVW